MNKELKKEVHDNEIIKIMLKNPKVIEALKGLLAPLEQEGDNLTIELKEQGK